MISIVSYSCKIITGGIKNYFVTSYLSQEYYNKKNKKFNNNSPAF